MVLPEITTPKALADHLGWSERFIRETARALNACLGRGRGMRLTQADVVAIMEAKRCPSRSTNGRAAKSIATVGGLPDIDYEGRRAQRTKSGRRELQPRKKPSNGTVISM